MLHLSINQLEVSQCKKISLINRASLPELIRNHNNLSVVNQPTQETPSIYVIAANHVIPVAMGRDRKHQVFTYTILSPSPDVAKLHSGKSTVSPLEIMCVLA